jgi:hypothetical protein
LQEVLIGKRGQTMSMHWSDLFIALYLFIAWCWNLPPDAPSKILLGRFSRVIVWPGLWHGWSMFAPIPLKTSRRLAVQVEYSDGSSYEWRPPGSVPQGYWGSFLHAHYRKYTDNVCSGKIKGLSWCLADVALRRLAQRVPANATPVRVAVIQESWPVDLKVPLAIKAEPIRKILFDQRLANGVLK